MARTSKKIIKAVGKELESIDDGKIKACSLCGTQTYILAKEISQKTKAPLQTVYKEITSKINEGLPEEEHLNFETVKKRATRAADKRGTIVPNKNLKKTRVANTGDALNVPKNNDIAAILTENRALYFDDFSRIVDQLVKQVKDVPLLQIQQWWRESKERYIEIKKDENKPEEAKVTTGNHQASDIPDIPFTRTT